MMDSEQPLLELPEASISAGAVKLSGSLTLPTAPRGVVLFAHGSGSSRHSTRNQFVARVLLRARLGTLLFDLLTADEEQAERHTRHLRFDIKLLAERLLLATEWLRHQAIPPLPTGYFGASTGAAAALIAAADLGSEVSAVVSRGGRPDLAADALPRVSAPTLLIVGGWDTEVIALNEQAYSQLRCRKSLKLVPRATHLFEEPGTLEQAAELAGEWFLDHLAEPSSQ